MSIIKLEYDNQTYQADLALDANGFISLGGGFEGPVTASLYSWARDPDVDPSVTAQPFGWWASQFSDDENDNYGSLLYTFRRERISNEVQSRLNTTLQNALQWMVTDGIARRVEVEVERFDTQVVAAKITVTRADGKTWDRIWEIQIDALL